jgi:hypothetical protein
MNENYKSVINIIYFLSHLHETAHLFSVHCVSTFHVIVLTAHVLTADVLSVVILCVLTICVVTLFIVLCINAPRFTTVTVCVIIIYFNVLHFDHHFHILSLIKSDVSTLCLFHL